ncbi:MAG: flagellar motor switch protein FliN [Armatimonadetes bacterium]|nr:flagellar motor switch protein FliN [Armatimonadota bacterium]
MGEGLSQDEMDSAPVSEEGASGQTPADSPELEVVHSADSESEAPADAAIYGSHASETASVQNVQFGSLRAQQSGVEAPKSIDLLLDVQLVLTAELGRRDLTIKEALALGPGSVVELDRIAGEPVDLYVNNKLIARGEVVVIDENFGVRVTEVVSTAERDNKVA